MGRKFFGFLLLMVDVVIVFSVLAGDDATSMTEDRTSTTFVGLAICMVVAWVAFALIRSGSTPAAPPGDRTGRRRYRPLDTADETEPSPVSPRARRRKRGSLKPLADPSSSEEADDGPIPLVEPPMVKFAPDPRERPPAAAAAPDSHERAPAPTVAPDSRERAPAGAAAPLQDRSPTETVAPDSRERAPAEAAAPSKDGAPTAAAAPDSRERAPAEAAAPDLHERPPAEAAAPSAAAAPSSPDSLEGELTKIFREHRSSYGLFIAPNIPEKKLTTATDLCCVEPTDAVIGLADCTALGTCESCLVFGRATLYFHNARRGNPKGHGEIPYAEFPYRFLAMGSATGEISLDNGICFDASGSLAMRKTILAILQAIKQAEIARTARVAAESVREGHCPLCGSPNVTEASASGESGASSASRGEAGQVCKACGCKWQTT